MARRTVPSHRKLLSGVETRSIPGARLVVEPESAPPTRRTPKQLRSRQSQLVATVPLTSMPTITVFPSFLAEPRHAPLSSFVNSEILV